MATITMDAKMAMIPMTSRSSMRVNPFLFIEKIGKNRLCGVYHTKKISRKSKKSRKPTIRTILDFLDSCLPAGRSSNVIA
jgi:hypothetical protein